MRRFRFDAAVVGRRFERRFNRYAKTAFQSSFQPACQTAFASGWGQTRRSAPTVATRSGYGRRDGCDNGVGTDVGAHAYV